MAQNKQKNTQTQATPKIEVRIDRVLPGEGKTKAFASATIGGAFAIHGIRIVDKLDSEKGFFIGMPQQAYLPDFCPGTIIFGAGAPYCVRQESRCSL